jgi:crotonobetainyl-CoA:carnitine CoA-transferase CaiB-like acyl-CoA transferase
MDHESYAKTDGLLKGFRAFDLTNEQGFTCGKILATLGVDVIKIEQPGGDPARNIPPFLGDARDPQKSLYWQAFNTDKRGITLNIKNAEGQEMFKRLIKQADFVLESFKPGTMDSLGLGYETLSKLNPRIIATSITPFGQKGPHSGFKASELVISAMGGIMDNTGDPDRAPVKESLEACYYHGNVAAAVGTVMAHYFRETTGEGQQVDVSLHEVAASRNAVNFIQWEFDKYLIKRSGPNTRYGGMTARTIWPCKDGYVNWLMVAGIMGEATNLALSRWMDDDGLPNPLHEIADWKAVDLPTLGRETIDRFEAAIGAFFLKHTKKELREEGLRRKINAVVLDGPDDMMNNIQLKARNYFREVDYPEWKKTLSYPGYFFLCSETQNFVRRRAPFVGEHNNEIYVQELGLSAAEVTGFTESGVI